MPQIVIYTTNEEHIKFLNMTDTQRADIRKNLQTKAIELINEFSYENNKDIEDVELDSNITDEEQVENIQDTNEEKPREERITVQDIINETDTIVIKEDQQEDDN